MRFHSRSKGMESAWKQFFRTDGIQIRIFSHEKNFEQRLPKKVTDHPVYGCIDKGDFGVFWHGAHFPGPGSQNKFWCFFLGKSDLSPHERAKNHRCYEGPYGGEIFSSRKKKMWKDVVEMSTVLSRPRSHAADSINAAASQRLANVVLEVRPFLPNIPGEKPIIRGVSIEHWGALDCHSSMLYYRTDSRRIAWTTKSIYGENWNFQSNAKNAVSYVARIAESVCVG